MNQITAVALDDITVNQIANLARLGIQMDFAPDGCIAIHADIEQLARIFDKQEAARKEGGRSGIL